MRDTRTDVLVEANFKRYLVWPPAAVSPRALPHLRFSDRPIMRRAGKLQSPGEVSLAFLAPREAHEKIIYHARLPPPSPCQ